MASAPKKPNYKSVSDFYTDYRNLIDKYQDLMKNSKKAAFDANEWFRNAAQQVIGITGNDIMAAASRKRLVPLDRIGPQMTGRMIMFFYNPKHRDTLPYYDMFPLVLPIKFYTGKGSGFLGLNLHYLPMSLRVRFLNEIYKIFKNKHLNERKQLELTYEMLQKSSRFRYFRPCIHRYLYSAPNGGGVKSRFYLVDPSEWDKMIALPVERFQGSTKERVWKESRRKLGL